MFPKEFIKQVLIKEVGKIQKQHAYIRFVLIAIGIEFLGKCNDYRLKTWHPVKSNHFVRGIKLMPKKYHKYDIKLRDLLRNGMAHSFAPKPGLGLSEEKWNVINLTIKNGILNLKIEDFYNDFEKACKKVLNKNYPNQDKMNIDFLKVPVHVK